MRAIRGSTVFSLALICALSTIFSICMLGQSALGQESGLAAHPLITRPIDESQLTTLKGNVHPLARPAHDLGTAQASLPMDRMLLLLKRSPAQESALRRLLDDQQDKRSENYHKWLTPEQYGRQFGPTDDDMRKISAGLQSHGFHVGTTQGRSVLGFSGSASQVQEAFHTAIHKYLVNGVQHWANAYDPQIPTALTGAVAGIVSLHNFPRKAMSHSVGQYSAETRQVTSAQPQYSFLCANNSNCYGIVAYDFAAIYDVLPLWTAGTQPNHQWGGPGLYRRPGRSAY